MSPGASGAAGGGRVDLHAHTHFSDGDLSPEDLVARARERGLVAVAVTDHDTVDGIAPARIAAADAIEVVPGIEISTSTGAMELHILGYYVDPGAPDLRARLEAFRNERVARLRAIGERLASLGAPVDVDAVLSGAGPGVVGRPHLAASLVAGGHAVGTDEAFRRFLGRGAPAFVPRPAFSPEEAISMIRGAGGISVLAHPGAALPDAVIESLVDAGLGGIEVWHPQHGPMAVRRHRALAERLHVVATGGSDFHGSARSADLGSLPVPSRVLGSLKRAAGVGV